MPKLRSLSLVSLLAILLAACGSSGGGGGAAATEPAAAASTEPGSDAQAEPTAEAAVSPTAESPVGAAPGAGSIPRIADGAWGAGTATAEISGDVSAIVKASMPADDGLTADGFTSFTFMAEDGTSVINIALSPTESSGFAVTSTPANVSTAGTWGVQGCSIDVTRNDASGIAATFSCSRIPAIGISEAKTYTIDLKGRFEVAR